MATTPAMPVLRSQFRLKYILLSALGLMFLFVLWHNERFIIDHSHPDWTYYFPVRWLLIPHGLAGLTALLIGPFQLSSRFRQRHLRVHRLMGRFYLCGIVIAGLMGVYIATVHTGLQLRLFVYTLAAAWLATGGMAFAAVRNGNIQVHRQWMTRNYGLTSLFVTGRVVLAVPFIHHGGDTLGIPALWILFIGTMVLTEIGLAWPGVFTNNRARSSATMGATVQ